MKKSIFALFAALLICAGASAQSFRSGYFLDNYVYGYRINPAQINQKSFAALGFGNIDLQQNSTIGMGTFLFPRNGKLVTGFNKAVSAQDFLGGLKNGMGIALDESFNILSFGVAKKDKWMHTFEINVRVQDYENLPYNLFAFLKQGGNQPYDISGIRAHVSAITDISYGYSRRISDKISVGGRAHFLLGVVNASVYTADSNISMTSSEAAVNANLYLQTSGLVKLSTKADGTLDTHGISLKGNPIGGFGAGLDLGVEYQPIDGLHITAGITELGFISWKYTTNLRSSTTLSYTGANITYNADGSVKTDLQAVLDKLKEATHFKDDGAGQRMDLMPFNATLGARYKMPFYKPLSFGVLGTYHYGSVASTTWYDVRAAVTFSPAYIFSMTVNAGYGTFGPTFGGAMNLHLGPVNLLVGADSYLGKMGKLNGIPLPLGGFMLNAHFGLGFTF